jgi:hypothetical protein
MPVSPLAYHLLGPLERCLPMGASCFCHFFVVEKLSDALQWFMMTKAHAAGMSHFKFSLLVPQIQVNVCRIFQPFVHFVTGLVFQSTQKKKIWRHTNLVIYDIEVESIQMIGRLPPDKV